MVERAGIVLAVVVLALLAAYVVRARARRQYAELNLTGLSAELAARLPISTPGIVYFYGPHCATCRQQAGVLDWLAETENVQMARIDASKETQLADELGVMTVPTTVVVDGSKRVRSVNPGFRGAEILREQLLSVGE
jgi:thioredoxin-like negative regulator of GroEL